MLNHYLACFNFNAIRSANVMIEVMRKLPFLKKIIKDSYTAEEKNKFRILSLICRFVFEFIKIFAFVLFFIYLPYRFFTTKMKTGIYGFSKENCFVYFILILSCFAGSILHSRIFEVNESSYVNLKMMKINPAIFFRLKFLERGLEEIVSFFIAFTIFGIKPSKAIYLVVIIAFSRYIGEALNILVFRVFRKKYDDIKGLSVVTMLLALFVAYFIPFIRGYVPDAYDLVFNTMLFHIILVLGCVFSYYAWSTENYDIIIQRVYTLNELRMEETTQAEENWIVYNKNEKSVAKRKYSGNKKLIDLFFRRNKRMFEYENMVKMLVIFFVLLVAFGAKLNGSVQAVEKVVTYSLPVLVFVMFSICDSSRFCKEMYRQCDRFLLNKDLTRDELADNFIFTLINLIKVNAIPVGMLMGAYLIVGLTVIGSAHMKLIMYICIGILLLGFMFTLVSLLLYYIIQPYDIKGKNINKIYTVLYCLAYVVCYGCLFIRTNNLNFLLGIGVATSIVTIISFTLIYFLGYKTFVIKR